MTDLSNLSDEQLMKMYSSAPAKPKPQPQGPMPTQGPEPKAKGGSVLSDLGDDVLKGLAWLGRNVDKYTGAPTRRAISDLQDGKNPVSGFAEQFGEDPSTAPTGEDIAKKMGLGEKPILPEGASPKNNPTVYKALDKKFPLASLVGNLYTDTPASKTVGGAIDLAADPINLMPAVGAANKLVKGTKLGERAGEIVGKGASLLAEPLKAGVTKMAEARTGIPGKLIRNYAGNTRAIDKTIKSTGGDYFTAADNLRQSWVERLRNAVASEGKKAGDALDAAPQTKAFSIEPVVTEMETAHHAVRNEKKSMDAAKEINAVVNEVTEMVQSGKGSIQDINEVKKTLQSIADTSYMKDGQVFATGDMGQRAAKAGAREARAIEMDFAPEAVKEANRALVVLHKLEKQIPKGLIKEGASEASILSAGTAETGRNSAMLKRLGKATGTDPMKEATDLATARAFDKPGLMSTDTTGKGIERFLRGGTTTGAVGGMIGGAIGGPVGAAIGVGTGIVANAFTSPAALKKAIQAGDISKDVITKLVGANQKIGGVVTDNVILNAFEKAKTPEGKRILEQFKEVAKDDEHPMKRRLKKGTK